MDFGTSRSGFAYKGVDEPLADTRVCLTYELVPPALPAYPKTLTALLYRKWQAGGWQAEAWGWPAQAQWSALLEAAERQGGARVQR